MRLRDIIDTSIADWRMPIPKELKQDYLRFQYKQNLTFTLLMNVVGFTLFLLYGLADWLILPDVADYSIVIRILLYVTLLPATIWLVKNTSNMSLLELLLPISTVFGTVFWFELALRSESPFISNYLYAGIIFVVFPNLGIRTNFLSSLAFTTFLSSIILYYVFRFSESHLILLNVYVLALIPFVLISLFTAWHNTNTGRRLYLFSVIEEMNKVELEEANQQLKKQSQTDHLTSLPNRYLLEDRIQQAIAQASRDNMRLALMIVDLDRFKPINDTHGHAVGDAVLKVTAERMTGCVRESDTVARVGGDEFVVLLPVIEADEDAVAVAKKIQYVLSQPFLIGEVIITTSSSLGIAIYPDQGMDANMLTRIADANLYRAKEQGRNCFVMNK
jgi:diguanylate cyclase (GGDEF)-like protein